MYKKISDYGIIGNLHTIALIALDGSIDWLCLPYIDSPSIFGALLDDKKGGFFSLSSADAWDSTAEYVEGTNILRTKFRTQSGIFQVTDFMPVPRKDDSRPAIMQELYRFVEVIKGTAVIRVVFEPRFDYARTISSFEKGPDGITVRGGKEFLHLAGTHEMTISDDRVLAEWNLPEGQRCWLRLTYGGKEFAGFDIITAEKSLDSTITFWQDWLKKSETGRSLDLGPYKKMTERSALVLKLLSYEPTGAIAAAATTSLPEEIGGVRNWDYRFTWVRDTSFTLRALFNLGHMSETESYLKWIGKLLSQHGADKMQIMYGIRGEAHLPEQELEHLEGYKGSKPVRIGNEAARQKQLDIYGELMDAALKLSNYVGKIDSQQWPFLRDVCEYVTEHWQDRDSGIWEVRGGPYQFVYSRVMCWVALDRGIIIAKRYGFSADLEKWESVREEIRKDVLEKGWNEEKQAFVQHYETDALDSSNLLIPILGFLPFDDPRIISTIAAIRHELERDGFLYRYAGDDNLEGGEGVFLLCTFWMIDNLIALKQFAEAERLLLNAARTANHLGLFSEEYDIEWKEALGNFPQAFTHIGYINSVHALRQAMAKLSVPKKDSEISKRFFPYHITLNDGDVRREIPPGEIASNLKSAMNILRGAFFDTGKGRVAYERMKNSPAYEAYRELSYSLKQLDLDELRSREDRIAFWINLYNVIVIHGVVEIGIRDSVKEVMNFFRRIQYQIGDMYFSPDHIEHGILRANSRPPGSIFRPFRKKDRRLRHIIDPPDPRIHFGLVCASSSCPPIDFYTTENLDEELTIAGKSFLNAGGVKINWKNNVVSLSRIFDWYGRDFGKSDADLLRFVAPYLYDEGDRSFLLNNSEAISITYQDYDWRLNRVED